MERKRSLADDRNVSTKKVDEVFCFLIWDRNDCIAEAKKKKWSDKNVYNKFFRDLKLDGHISN